MSLNNQKETVRWGLQAAAGCLICVLWFFEINLDGGCNQGKNETVITIIYIIIIQSIHNI